MPPSKSISSIFSFLSSSSWWSNYSPLTRISNSLRIVVPIPPDLNRNDVISALHNHANCLNLQALTRGYKEVPTTERNSPVYNDPFFTSVVRDRGGNNHDLNVDDDGSGDVDVTATGSDTDNDNDNNNDNDNDPAAAAAVRTIKSYLVTEAVVIIPGMTGDWGKTFITFPAWFMDTRTGLRTRADGPMGVRLWAEYQVEKKRPISTSDPSGLGKSTTANQGCGSQEQIGKEKKKELHSLLSISKQTRMRQSWKES